MLAATETVAKDELNAKKANHENSTPGEPISKQRSATEPSYQYQQQDYLPYCKEVT